MIKSPIQLPEIARRVVEQVQALEASWWWGAIEVLLGLPEVRDLLGPVALAYDRLGVEPSDRIRPYREHWIQNVLDEFTLQLAAPRRRFRAATGKGDGFVVELDGRAIGVRLDQAIRVGVWGISLLPADSRSAAKLATSMFHSALYRLAEGIGCIGKICRAVAAQRVHPEAIRWQPATTGTYFEHLLVDVLNEDHPRARRATLFEDLFEWTDLRVHYPDLPRRRGARVQVKFTPSLLAEAVPPGRNVETHVILSPARLATYVEGVCTGTFDGSLPPGFWDELGADPADATELGEVLFQRFNMALTEPDRHPLGPVAGIPPSLRALVRQYTWTESFEACRRMRSLLSAKPNAARSWIRILR